MLLRLDTFARYAWGVLAANLAVIAWGAYVRATGSGAGCGQHWPLCNGEVIPRAERIQTIIELTHRVTSGLALVLVVAMAVWAFRARPRGSVVRRGAIASVVLMLSEALIGAGLVLLKLVEHDASVMRAVSTSLHLTNTFLLLAALTLTAWWASGGERVRLRGQGAAPWILAAPLAGAIIVATSGAIAALGDTLFPSASLAQGLADDASPTAHLFIRLRVLHPFLAGGVSAIALVCAGVVPLMRRDSRTRAAARAVHALVFVQVCAGLVNLALLAPVSMQLVHLLLADALWIALVLLTATALAERTREAAQAGVSSKTDTSPTAAAAS
jgi:heme A synthase